MQMSLPVTTDSLSRYLAEVRAFPLLSEDDEHRLAVRLYDHNDLQAAQTLITSNLRFVVKVANEYRSYGLKMLDLIQEGNVGLMLAVRKFNPYRGLRLVSYAVWWIRAQIQSFIISSWSLVKIGTTQAQRKLFYKLKQAKQAIASMTGNESVDALDTAAYLNVDAADVDEMDQRMMGEVSLDAPLGDTEGFSLMDTLVDDRPNQEQALAARQESHTLKRRIATAMAGLTVNEQTVIRERVTAEEPLTLQELSSKMGVSRERVRQIEENALRKLKRQLADAA